MIKEKKKPKNLDIGHWVLDIGCSEIPNIVYLSLFGNPAARKSISSYPRERFDFAQRDREWIDGNN